MRIAAVSTVLNEADIIGDTLAHLYAHGVANIYIADGHSTDGTRDIYSRYPVKVYDQTEDYHAQPKWITHLAQQAFEDGADWVIPFDADEFVVTVDGSTIAETLGRLPPIQGVGLVPMVQHLDYEWREPDWKPLPKVVFRATDGIRVHNGNHAVSGVPGTSTGCGIVIREVQYRSFEHFQRKIVERNRTIDPRLGPGEGFHHKRYAGWTPEQLKPVWAEMVARASVYDPIPIRR